MSFLNVTGTKAPLHPPSIDVHNITMTHAAARE
jgi:hypothetical protein